MAYTVFFSWQSDHNPNEGRNLIESAIKSAIKRLGEDAEIEESLRDGFSLDKDTKGVLSQRAMRSSSGLSIFVLAIAYFVFRSQVCAL